MEIHRYHAEASYKQLLNRLADARKMRNEADVRTCDMIVAELKRRGQYDEAAKNVGYR